MVTPTAMRIWYVTIALLIWLGIILTGFSAAHWLLYIPAIGLTFAAITGICPGQVAISKLLGPKQTS